MDRIIHTPDIKLLLLQEVNNTKSNIDIISAYVKLEAIKFVEMNLRKGMDTKRLLIRFELSDLINGSTDIDIFEYCKQNNWELFVNFNLHSKIYVFDRERISIGSANLTERGIGNINIESLVNLKLNAGEFLGIDRLFDTSIKLTDSLFNKMKLCYESIDKTKNNNKIAKWPDEVYLHDLAKGEFLWTTELPFSSSPTELCEHDICLFNLQKDINNLELVKNKFMQSRSYYWLKSSVLSEIYFGELSAKLHAALLDDPKPYRRDVKRLLSDLLNWVVELRVEDFEVSRPNYSQKIRRV